ncbi:response regulator [Burkholderia glumae]|uniref:response regulator n=1 Tax=Burkholderia glumae TaxID=337 RepID=UPI0020B459D6|nr:response regulator [Burkholderia glumae]
MADDNADMRHYLNSLLGGAYRVEAVADGARLLDAARRERPDLVLTDVMMPNLDGFAVRSALREDPRLREVPVILLSARAGEEARIAALDAGVDDYLVKPFSARELLARIGAVSSATGRSASGWSCRSGCGCARRSSRRWWTSRRSGCSCSMRSCASPR